MLSIVSTKLPFWVYCPGPTATTSAVWFFSLPISDILYTFVLGNQKKVVALNTYCGELNLTLFS